jgi:hypothetical protein
VDGLDARPLIEKRDEIVGPQRNLARAHVEACGAERAEADRLRGEPSDEMADVARGDHDGLEIERQLADRTDPRFAQMVS